MTERDIMVRATPFQINRCIQLDQSLKKIRLYGQLLKEGGGQPIPIKVDRQNTVLVDKELILALNKSAFSFYVDLKEQDLGDIAKDIIHKNTPEKTNAE